jgi:hypothetical protein
MNTAQKSAKASSRKTRAASPVRTARKTKAKAAGKRRTLKPKPRGTHPSKKDVGIFGRIQKNLEEGLSALTGTLLPSPDKKSARG